MTLEPQAEYMFHVFACILHFPPSLYTHPAAAPPPLSLLVQETAINRVGL